MRKPNKRVANGRGRTSLRREYVRVARISASPQGDSDGRDCGDDDKAQLNVAPEPHGCLGFEQSTSEHAFCAEMKEDIPRSSNRKTKSKLPKGTALDVLLSFHNRNCCHGTRCTCVSTGHTKHSDN